jgi:hypothetical protein
VKVVKESGTIRVSHEGIGFFNCWDKAKAKARALLFREGWDTVEVWPKDSPDICYRVGYRTTKVVNENPK